MYLHLINYFNTTKINDKNTNYFTNLNEFIEFNVSIPSVNQERNNEKEYPFQYSIL